MLRTVRSVEGAYWYLANMTSSSVSSEEKMVQNTAINTLLQSDDNNARLLLGKLESVSEPDISFIDNIDNPGSCAIIIFNETVSFGD